jgi:hypothetical protein
VVEFTLEQRNRVRDEKTQLEGTVKLLRTAQGQVLASYSLAKPGAAGNPEWIGLLNGGTPYMLLPEKKQALRFVPENGDVRFWLEERFNPLALLLNSSAVKS